MNLSPPPKKNQTKTQNTPQKHNQKKKNNKNQNKTKSMWKCKETERKFSKQAKIT